MKIRLTLPAGILCLGIASLLLSASCNKKNGADNFDAKWKKVNIPYTDAIKSIYFTSKDTGYAVGNTDYNLNNGTFRSPYLVTYDGGETWRVDTLHVNKIVVNNIFSNGKDLYLCGKLTTIHPGDPRVLCRSTDKAKTWKIIDSTHFISDVKFWTPAKGLSVYSNSLYTTIDSGKHFSLAGYIDQGGFGSPQILSNQIGYLIGGRQMYRTNDAGASWSVGTPFTFSSIISMHFVNPNTGYIYMDDGEDGFTGNITPHNGKLIKTTDAGNTWNIVRADLLDKLGEGAGAYFKTETLGYIATTSAIYSTNNGGASWQQEFDAGTPVANKYIFGLYFTPGGIGFAYGSSGIFKQIK